MEFDPKSQTRSLYADNITGLQFYLHRNAESCYFSTSDFFKLRHETSTGMHGTTLPDSDILIAQGNYVSRGQGIVSDFVCETKSRENDFKFLSAKLSKDLLGGQEAVLPVLGYRQPLQILPDGTKMFQLVFELPTGPDRSSLSHLLHTRPGPDLVERLALCRKLAVATKTIHSIGLVHKALRARSMPILSTPGAPLSTAKAYLQDWSCAREVSGTTAELGEGVWPKRIYQHPERQGEYAEAAYEPRHDIYSLGVCMLERLGAPTQWFSVIRGISGQSCAAAAGRSLHAPPRGNNRRRRAFSTPASGPR
jgi:serine/threonine protein kinase